ncbi:ABC transporter permease [Fundidesulfovibrio butyratiphilus]
MLPVLASVVLPLTAGALLFACLGTNPLKAYQAMLAGAFGSTARAAEVLVKATPLMLTGLAVTLSARMSLWNIGCEGQLVLGGVFATGAALWLGPGLPAWAALPLCALAGAVGGGLWALGPAYMKARLDVSEIITTLLLNYVAITFMEYLYFGPWRDPGGMGFPGTALFPDSTVLPRLPGTRIHPGLAAALLLAAGAAWMLAKTRLGFELTVMGQNPRAAAYAGMDARSRCLWALTAGGALAGLAGAGEVCAVHHRLQAGLAAGYGYDGVIVACLAGLSPAFVPAAAVVLSAVLVGGDYLQTRMQLPSSVGQVMEACLLFALLWLQSRRRTS